MKDFSFILIGAYFLYYGGNIVYDLFLKKERILQTDMAEEFSIGDFAQTKENPTKVEIEDVENLNTPTSFLKKEFQYTKNGVEDSKPEIEDLRRRFEAEQDIDEEIEETSSDPFQPSDIEHNVTVIEQETREAHVLKNEEPENNKLDWRSILKLSETSVKMVANYEGQKVYHSIL